MPQFWKVVGGADKGGLVVRRGKGLKTEQEPERLSTGALVKEAELAAGRLSYLLFEGRGPATGWVSVAMAGKELCVKVETPPGAENFGEDDDLPQLVEGPDGDVAVERLTMEYQRSDDCKRRCEMELAKKVPAWTFISIAQVTENHAKSAPGMFYGLEFPWTEQMLIGMGPGWLTKAFRAAGTLEADNEVTRVIPEPRVKVTTGNNGGKFLFEVRYKTDAPGLHTKLFAKIPHPCEGVTRSDRLSTSVNKQPMEFYELNSSRLLEATLPVKIPKFYYGDISNETSNWILITERIPFADREPLDFAGKLAKSGERRGSLKPFAVEGPYDKCLDWTLRGSPAEYYLALVRCGARMAGLHKAGKMGDPAALAAHFEDWSRRPMEVFGCKPAECTGSRPKDQKVKIDMALKFMSEEGQAIFPPFCSEPIFQSKMERTLLTLNGYMAESMYWRHSDQDYIALTHNNMNVDNAFFWRDEAGQLDLGVLDWGSMGQKSLGWKLWWWLYCCEFDIMTANIDAFLECFVDAYAEAGGPRLSKEVMRMQYILTACEQMLGLCAAVPQIYKMCKKAEWKTVKSRFDPRIGLNVDGKSTLRLYLQVMSTIAGIIHDPKWAGAEVVDRWIDDFCSSKGVPKKDVSVLFP